MPPLCEFVVMVLIIKEICYHLRRRKISLCQAQNAVSLQEPKNSLRILIRTETYPDLDYCNQLSHNSMYFKFFYYYLLQKFVCIFIYHSCYISCSFLSPLFKQTNTIFSTMHYRKAPICSFLSLL